MELDLDFIVIFLILCFYSYFLLKLFCILIGNYEFLIN